MKEVKIEQLDWLVDLHKKIKGYTDLKCYLGSLKGLSPDASMKLKNDLRALIGEAESSLVSCANSYGD